MYGQRTDVNYNLIGQQSFEQVNKITGNNSNAENTKDSSQSVSGSRNDNSQFTKGSQNDTSRSLTTDSGSELRHGVLNLTQAEVMSKHKNLWSLFNFYSLVFGDICEQFLLVA